MTVKTVEVESGTKTCTRCGLTKNLGDFYKNSSSPDGHRSMCKICHNSNRGTSGTKKNVAMGNDNSSLERYPPKEMGGVPRGFGTHLVLALPENLHQGMVYDNVDMCPSCSKHNILFKRRLQAPGITIPFGICNDCIWQVNDRFIDFYIQNDVIYIVRSVSTINLLDLHESSP